MANVPGPDRRLTEHEPRGDITFMALARKKATTIALPPELDELLTRAAEARGISRSEFVRRQLDLVLEQYRKHPKPKSAGVLRKLQERGDEAELFRDL
ncbi:MAG: ribbon-helix-helix protein, CopG family [Archangiaceae bacterium]|nr:ribbon-helix-helix protein, CopG family [Archangiaceae bacterium]